MTAEELIERAAACRSCGKVHAHRWIAPGLASWAADDGHAYQPFTSAGNLALLRYLATGVYADPFQGPAKPPAARTVVNAVMRRS